MTWWGLRFGGSLQVLVFSWDITPPNFRKLTRGSGARCPRPPAFCFQRHPGAIPQDWRERATTARTRRQETHSPQPFGRPAGTVPERAERITGTDHGAVGDRV